MKAPLKHWPVLFFFVLTTISSHGFAQNVKLIQFKELQNVISDQKSEVLIINFWATWCKPCLEELPIFETISKKYSLKDVRVVLVSLDFLKEFEKLKTFVSKNKLSSEVVLLNEPDYDIWIDKVDSSWGGAIPATLIIDTKSGKKTFYEQSLNIQKLESQIKNIISR